MSLEISDEGWDRTCLDLSSKMAEPLVWAFGLLRYRLVAPLEPNKFDNRDSQISEIGIRALIAGGALFALATAAVPILFAAVALGTASKIFRAIGFYLQKDGYTHVRGKLAEKDLVGAAKIATWNLCGIGGGMNYDHGGVTDWRSRLDHIVQKIVEEAPDVLVLQEIYDTAFAEALVVKLEALYAHFFMHLGANTWGSVGGGMVLSKCAIHRFTNTSFENNEWTLNRTFTTLDIKNKPEDALPCARVIGTHLIHDNNANRMVQVAQIIKDVAFDTLPLPTLLVGDLNLERDKQEEGGFLSSLARHSYFDKEPTCTNEMVRQWEQTKQSTPGETIDYISLLKDPIADKIHMENAHLIRAFDDTYNTQTALSDHHGLATTISGFLN